MTDELEIETTEAWRTAIEKKPHIVLDRTHYERLHDVAIEGLKTTPSVAKVLLDELDRAEIREPDAMPQNVVTMGSNVTFQYDDMGRVATVRLVYPDEADNDQRWASVLTPVGATLIGLSEGDRMRWGTWHDKERSLTVLAVDRPDVK